MPLLWFHYWIAKDTLDFNCNKRANIFLGEEPIHKAQLFILGQFPSTIEQHLIRSFSLNKSASPTAKPATLMTENVLFFFRLRQAVARRFLNKETSSPPNGGHR